MKVGTKKHSWPCIRYTNKVVLGSAFTIKENKKRKRSVRLDSAQRYPLYRISLKCTNTSQLTGTNVFLVLADVNIIETLCKSVGKKQHYKMNT